MKKQKVKILLIQENISEANSILKFASKHFDHVNYEITHSKKVTDANELLMEQTFDVILFDITFNSTGIESLKSLAKSASQIPIIALSDRDDNEFSAEIIKAGAKDYLIKNTIDYNLFTRSIYYAIERNRTETLLRISKELYSTFFENTKDVFYRTDLNGIIKFVSPAVKNYGYSVAEIIDQDVRTFFENPSYRDFILETLIKEKAIYDFEISLKKKNSSFVPVSLSAILITDHTGKPIYIDGIFRDISDRRKVEEQYHYLFQNNPSPMWIYDLETLAFLEINEAAIKQYGYTRSEFLGMTLKDIRPVEDVPKLLENLKTSKDSYQKSHDWRHKKKDGTIIDVEITSHSIIWNNKPARVVSVNDITLKKLAEETLRESEEKFRTIANMNIAAIFIYSNPKFIYVNPASESLTGYRGDELLEMNFWDIVHPDFRELIKERGLSRINGKSVPSQYEFKIITKYGEEKWLSFSAETIQYKGNKASLGVAFDITQKKQSEQIQLALYRISKITNNTKDLDSLYKKIHQIIGELMDAKNFYIALYDQEKDLISFPYFVDETNFRPEPKKPGKGMTEYVLRTGKSCLSDLKHFLNLQHQGEIELIGEPSPIWLGVPLNIDNKTIGVMAIQHYSNPKAYSEREQQILEFISSEVARAIEHKRSEEKLKLLATAFESAANAIVITDREGNITWANSSITKITGYNLNEIIGKNPRIFKSGKHDRAFYENLWNTITTGKVWGGEIINKKKDGTLYNEEITITPMFDENGNITNFIGVKQDVTEKKKMQAQFLRSQRMESIGILAGGIAHDLNNVIAPIMMAVELLSRNQDETQKKNMLEIIRTSAARGANIVKQILTFSRGIEGERSLLQPKHLIREIESFAKETFPKDIVISVNIAKDLWTLVGDATQIHQVLLKLCVNARDAMPNGGKLIISAENINLDEGYSKMHTEAKPGAYVVLKVSDTGTGIPDSIINKIFDPFFTTKEVGKGTGLGLSTVHGIVQNHKGFITVYSEVGKGTEFKVYLPASEGTSKKETQNNNNKIPKGNGELILFVDDEQPIREITKQTLESNGYKVITACDGVEAIALFAQNKDKIELVLTDMAMPVLGGASTIKAIQKINPKIKIIVTSGLLTHNIDEEKHVTVLKGFLQKPFTSEKLLKTIHDVLKNS